MLLAAGRRINAVDRSESSDSYRAPYRVKLRDIGVFQHRQSNKEKTDMRSSDTKAMTKPCCLESNLCKFI